MINLFSVAKKLWADIQALAPEHKTDDIVEAAITNVLIEVHGAGYHSAKDFYIDKEPGWGKPKEDRDSAEFKETIEKIEARALELQEIVNSSFEELKAARAALSHIRRFYDSTGHYVETKKALLDYYQAYKP